MKNLFLLAVWLLFMPAAVHAQLQKNNLLLEGSFAYSRSTPKYSTVTLPSGPNGQVPMDIVSQSLLLSPTAGLFLTDRLALSGGIIYSRSSHKQESPPCFLRSLHRLRNRISQEQQPCRQQRHCSAPFSAVLLSS